MSRKTEEVSSNLSSISFLFFSYKKFVCTELVIFDYCFRERYIIYDMISTRGHTSVCSKTSMSERQSLWGLGSKAKQIVENVLTTSTKYLQQTYNVCNIADSTTYRCWPRPTKSAVKASI